MRLTEENKRRIRQSILTGAAKALREEGYEAVNLDRIMGGAGLTRGAFYAHFRSKEELFREVIRHEHPILRMLKARDGQTGVELNAQLRAILAGYLDPKNLDKVFDGCTIAALTGDTARASPEVRAAYGEAWEDILSEMARGQVAPPAAFAPVFTLASGAVRSARAMSSPDQRAAFLSAALDAVERLLPPPQAVPA